MKQPAVLVIADNRDFAQSLMGRWHSERTVPAFTVMNSEVVHPDAAQSCNLVICGGLLPGRMAEVAAKLAKANAPVILVAADTEEALQAAQRSSRCMLLRQHDGWVDLLILLASECLRRIEMTERAEEAEHRAEEFAAEATLGRYMLDMRHSFNNALTSVLGNAELLLMDPGNFSEEIREQLTTIRSMSLRMNEIVARFSSLETELRFAKREAAGESMSVVRSTAAGWSSF